MSVVSCKLLPTGSGLTVDSKFTRTYTHEWLVETNDPNLLQLQVLLQAAVIGGNNDPIPSLWTYYDMGGSERDTGSFLQDVKVSRFTSRDDDRYFWKIVGTWKPPEKGQSSNEPPVENPLERPVKKWIESAHYRRKVTRDVVDDRPIANSAGDLYEDEERDDARPILVCVKNLADLDVIIAQILNYQNAVNSDVFYGAQPGYAKIDSIDSGQPLSENGIDYYAVTYKIQFTDEPDGWNRRYDNRGSQAYDIDKDTPGDPPPVKQRVKALNGEYMDFAYLAYDGTQLADGATPLPIPAVGDPAFRIYQPKIFAALGLGGS